MKTFPLVVVAIMYAVAVGCGKSGREQSGPQATAAEPPHGLPATPPRKSESRHLAPGIISVRMLGPLDSATPNPTPVRASIAEDVMGADSRLAIPAESGALVVPIVSGKNGDVSGIGLALWSVDVDGHQYRLVGEDRNPAVAFVSVNSMKNPAVKTTHISGGDVVDFKLLKPAELR